MNIANINIGKRLTIAFSLTTVMLAWLAWFLLALFLLERILTHARRN